MPLWSEAKKSHSLRKMAFVKDFANGYNWSTIRTTSSVNKIRSFFFLFFRRSEVASEEKPESSLVKNLSIAGHVVRGEEQPVASTVDAPQGGAVE